MLWSAEWRLSFADDVQQDAGRRLAILMYMSPTVAAAWEGMLMSNQLRSAAL